MITTLFTTIKPFLIKGANVAWENRNQLALYFKTKFWKYRNVDIRFSISGLYKIQIPGANKYLLVLNRRIENQLQPVGGAYKRYADDTLFNKWGYKPDNLKNGLDVDEKSSSDLRFMVNGKHCIEVLNWFDTGNERELDPKREFKEELLDTGILDSAIFQNFNHKRIRRFSKNLIWSDFFSCYEILIYDIFELIPNDAQKKYLVELSKQKNDLSKGFAIVDCDSIEQLRLIENGTQISRIGQHTKLIINKDF
ncbi:SMODS-associated NUDIX domain-containing protein [Chryseobacterium vrystaatense]|uniref:CD-NTase-associated protein 16 NUDIX domain-containing protein n=1 Tax=Chryseobacterium vrystaatense TaxID=307480 RepID=A0A1M5GU31_9FLAO|nr:hypothetical protein [Chryseobacterium vrystaatense]SHG06922.1 hypothetical protein SAMN02787073_3462 [Chryseobacterium vrystaatense]